MTKDPASWERRGYKKQPTRAELEAEIRDLKARLKLAEGQVRSLRGRAKRRDERA